MPRAFNEQPALWLRRGSEEFFCNVQRDAVIVAAVHEKCWHAKLGRFRQGIEILRLHNGKRNLLIRRELLHFADTGERAFHH